MPNPVNTRKLELKTEFGSLKRDWLERKGVDLESVNFTDLKKYIREFYSENKEVIEDTLEGEGSSLETELSGLSSKKMSADKVSQIREKIGLPKKVSLAETVAFIKTAIDLDDQKIKEKYFEYCAQGLSLDDMRQVLAYENDVKPARLDTDIYHQSPQRSRSAVEIVSNAIDALKKEGNTIGRFGVGFYQILSHLQSEDDYVRVETGDPVNGFYEIEFSLKNKEIQIKLDRMDQKEKSGTSVILHSKDFPKEEAEKLIEKHFSYNNVAEVFCNEKKVNDLSNFKIDQENLPKVAIEISENGYKVVDTGVGMSPQIILEKLIVPKFSGKQSIKEFLDMENINASYMVERRENKEDKEKGKVVLNVGGVMIEEVEINGINSAKTVVIDLPAFTMLGEERNEVAVDEITITALKKLIKDIVSKKDIELINSIAPLIGKLQGRSLDHEEKNNLVRFLKNEARENLDTSAYYLPNYSDFDRVMSPNVTLIDPEVIQTHWNKIPGFSVPRTSSMGKVIYTGPLSENKDVPMIETHNKILIDSKVYDSIKEDPTLLNIYLDTWSKATGQPTKKIEPEKAKKISDNSLESKEEFTGVKDFFIKESVGLGFFNEDSALLYAENLRGQKLKDLELIYETNEGKLPRNLLKYLFLQATSDSGNKDSDSWINQNSLNTIISLSNSKELVGLLNELDINIVNTTETKPDAFEDFNPKPQIYTEGSLKNWHLVKYKDQNNLVDPSGKIYYGVEPYARYNNSEPAIMWGGAFFKKENELHFFNLETKKSEKVLDMKERDGINFGLFGDKNLIIIENGNVNRNLVNIKELNTPVGVYGELSRRIYDFNSKEEFNPRPDLGDIVSFQNSKIIYAQKDGSRKNAPNKFTSLYPDGSIEELTIESEVDGVTKALNKKIGAELFTNTDDKIIKLILNGIVISEIPLEYHIKEDRLQKINSGNYSDGSPRNSSSGLNWRITQSLNAKQFSFEDKNYILQQYVPYKGTLSTKIGGGNGQYVPFGTKSECVLFDENGAEIYKSAPNEFLRWHTTETGNTVLLNLSYKSGEIFCEDEKSIENIISIKNISALDLKGNLLSGDDLKSIDPVLFVNGKENTNGAFSLYQGESWELKFDQSTKKVTYRGEPDVYTISIIDKNTKTKLVEYDFASAVYDKEQNLWKCVVFEDLEEKADDKHTEKVVYIDSIGKIVKELERVSDMYEHPDWDYSKIDLYNNFYFGDKAWDRKPILNHFDLGSVERHELNTEKTNIMYGILSAHSEKSKIDVERFIKRCFEYGNLDDKSFSSIAPILLNVEEINSKLINNESISALSGRINKYDQETKNWFYTLLSKTLPEEADDVFVEKFIKIFENKIAHTSNEERIKILESFNQVKDYGGEYLVNGWNIVQHKTPVPSELIPDKIRPIVDFLRINEGESIVSARDEIEFSSDVSITLSQLIQTKRLNETQIQNFSGMVTDLVSLVGDKTKDKKQDHIKREIIHPIYYQGVNNPYLFIRELVQNAHDALIMNPELDNKNVTIDLFSREEKEVTMRIEDGAGMSLKELLNYFLIPGETTKLDNEKAIGYFGQGLFTLFRGAKEVVLKTSKGDGLIQKLKITPKLDKQSGVEDLNIVLEQENGNYRGTVIERTVESEYPTVESSYIKNAACTYTSLVDGNVIDIKLNGSNINNPQKIMSSMEIPGIGMVELYDAPNNVVTQKGLYMKGLDLDYKTKLGDVETLLEKRGYVVNLPDSLSLTRSRNELAQKEKILPILQEYMPLLKIKAYIEIFREDIIKGHVIQLANLPYDYFYRDYSANSNIESDAKKISEGNPIENVEKYLDRGSLVHLLVLLPAIEMDNKTWSILQLKNAAKNNSAPLERPEKYKELPSFLREKLLEGKSTREEMSRSKAEAKEKGELVPDFDLDSLSNQPTFIQDQINANYDQYKRMADYADNLNLQLMESFQDQNKVKTTFFSEPSFDSGIILAHAGKGFNGIGWNLKYWHGWRMRFNKEELGDKDIKDFLETYTHEFAHIKEKSSHMTHNQDFYRTQASIISRLLNIKMNEK